MKDDMDELVRLLDEELKRSTDTQSEAQAARMKLGDCFCTYLLLLGLTIETGLSWWWWAAAFGGGWVINMAVRHTAQWYVRLKRKRTERIVMESPS